MCTSLTPMPLANILSAIRCSMAIQYAVEWYLSANTSGSTGNSTLWLDEHLMDIPLVYSCIYLGVPFNSSRSLGVCAKSLAVNREQLDKLY